MACILLKHLWLWESLRADIFTINKKHYLCIVDYHSKFPTVKQLVGFTTDKLIETFEIIFSEYGLPSKIISDVEINFTSEKFKNLCKQLSTNHTVSSSNISSKHWRDRGMHKMC